MFKGRKTRKKAKILEEESKIVEEKYLLANDPAFKELVSLLDSTLSKPDYEVDYVCFGHEAYEKVFALQAKHPRITKFGWGLQLNFEKDRKYYAEDLEYGTTSFSFTEMEAFRTRVEGIEYKLECIGRPGILYDRPEPYISYAFMEKERWKEFLKNVKKLL